MRTGLTRAAARRYLVTRVHLRYARHRDKLFSLTPKVLRLGQSYLHSARLPRIVQPLLLPAGVFAGGGSVGRGVRGDELVCVAAASAGRVVWASLQPRTRVPAFCTANGRVMLGSLPQEQVEAYLERITPEPHTEYTIVDKERLLVEIKRARAQGSTGGGEVARYVGRHGTKRLAKLGLVSAVPPLMLKTADNPSGLPIAVFDGIRDGSEANRSQLYLYIASGPFYGFNRPGAKVSQGLVQSWWMQGMTGGHKNTYDSIKAFSQTDFRADLKKFDKPTLIIHGDDDQTVPIDLPVKPRPPWSRARN